MGPITSELFFSKFGRFNLIHSNLISEFDKSLKWFLIRVNITIAKSNYKVFKNHKKLNNNNNI